MIFALLVCSFGDLFAGLEPVLTSRKQGSTYLQIDSMVVVEDDKLSCIQAANCSPGFVSTRLDGGVILGIDHDFDGCYSSFNLTVNLQVKILDSNLVETTKNIDLSLSYNPAAGFSTDDKAIFRVKNAYKIETKITGFISTLAGGVMPENVYLENILLKERWYSMDYTSSPSFGTQVQPASDELTLSWSSIAGAEEYDLEWVYVDDFSEWDGSGVSYFTQSDLSYSFLADATRISTNATSYTIKNLYEHGYLLFRVRGVNRAGEEFTQRMEGRWSNYSYGDTGLVSDFGTLAEDKFYVDSTHEENFNWQWSSGFAEEGKSKTVISYFDGTLRSRQMVTHNNTDHFTIVGESYYDHVGRQAVSALPSPTHESVIKYYQDYNVVRGTGDPYSWRDFDTTDGVSLCETHAAEMDTISGSSQYYSNANPVRSGFNAYIPDANFYPLVQTEFTPDMTGRIRRQGGVGVDHQLGTGHETKYYYTSVGSQQELLSLFGVEVGNYVHYKKNMVIDPNGQVSISYMNPAGQVIATSLAGRSPDNVIALPGDTAKRPVYSDLTPSNRTEPDGKSWVVNKTISLSQPSNVKIDYTFTDIELTSACDDDTICYTCAYDLSLSLTDECGNVILEQELINFRPFDTTCVNDSFDYSFEQTLGLGTYHLYKKLTVNEESFLAYEEVFLANQTCIKSVEELYDSLVNTLDYSTCFTGCEACIDSLGTFEDFISIRLLEEGHDTLLVSGDSLIALYSIEYNQYLGFCRELCDTLNECENLLFTILQDVSPGGQYMTYVYNDSGELEVTDQLSFLWADGNTVLHPNTAGGNPRNWQADDIWYLEASGDTSYIEYEGQVMRPNYLPQEEFLAQWRPSWAYALAEQHPEYCYYKWCLLNQDASDFDFQLMWTMSYEEAEDQLLLNPLKINNPDAPGTYSSMTEDPFFISGSYGYSLRSYAEDRCNNYATEGASTYSIWDMSVIMTFCQDAEDEAEINSCLSANSFGSGDSLQQANQWDKFRSMYRGIRMQLLDSARANYANDSSCSNCRIGNNGQDLYSTSCYTAFNSEEYANKQKLFPSNREALGVDLSAAASEISDSTAGHAYNGIADQCQSNCEAYADYWMQKLDSCDFDSSDSLAIRDSLIRICVLGCDSYNPLGASSVAPGNSALVTSQNFGELLESFGIPNFRSKLCSEDLIAFPLPYGMDYNGENYTLIPDSCFYSEVGNLAGGTCNQTSENVALTIILDELIALNSLESSSLTNLGSVLSPTALTFLDYLTPYFSVAGSQTVYYQTHQDASGNLYMTFIADSAGVQDSCALILQPDEADMPYTYSNITGLSEIFASPIGCSDANQVYTGTVNFTGTGLSAYPSLMAGCFPLCSTGDTFTLAERLQQAISDNYCIGVTLDQADNYVKMLCGDTTVREFIPVELTCYRPCVSCKEAYQAKSDFFAKYEGVYSEDSTNLENDTNFQDMFAAFVNKEYHLNVTYEEIISLLNSCDTYVSGDPDSSTALKYYLYTFDSKEIYRLAKGCVTWNPSYDTAWQDTLLQYLTLCSSPLFNPLVSPEEISCDSLQREFAMQRALSLYEQRLEQAKADFRQSYFSACTAISGYEKFTMEYELKEYHFTLYYYDQAGNLIKTVPPEGVHIVTDQDTLDLMDEDRNNSVAANYSNTPHHTFVTNYVYNSLNEVRSQSTPDGGSSLFFYDELGRLVVSQNAKQNANSVNLDSIYSYTQFDELGRIVEVGETHSPNAMTGSISRNNGLLGAWMTNCMSFNQVTYTVYEDTLTNADVLAKFGSHGQENLRNRISYVYVYDDDVYNSESGHLTAYSYDLHGNVKTLVQDFFSLTFAEEHFGLFKIDYDYDLVSGNVKQVKYQNNENDQFYHKYQYDADNRIQSVYTSSDNLLWAEDARYQYYMHGPLARVETGDLKVQGTDYAYTIHGWLKGVNSATLDSSRDMGQDGWFSGDNMNQYIPKDEFGFTLGYYQGDYQSISSIDPVNKFTLYSGLASGWDNAAPSLYNGNIRHMTVAIAKFMEGSPTNKPIGYAYKYDQLNRIMEMNAYDSIDLGTNSWYISASALPFYHNRFTYDGNGNILSQVRRGGRKGPQGMDSLTYNYASDKNQLTYVDDAIGSGNYGIDIDDQSSDNYQYDPIGNLISDASEGIDSIEWNVYGKISRIYHNPSRGLPDLEFKYSPDGQRTIKRLYYAGTDSILSQEYYVRDASGNIMAVYALTETNIHTEKDKSYASIIPRLIDLKGQEAYAAFITQHFSGNSDWLDTTYTFIPPSGMESTFTMSQVLNCMGDEVYGYLFGSCDSCGATSQKVVDSLMNTSYYSYDCVSYDESLYTTVYQRDYSYWPVGTEWVSTAPFYTLKHDAVNERMEVYNTTPASISMDHTETIASGAEFNVRFDIEVESGYDDIQAEIWDGTTMIYGTTVPAGTGVFQVNESFTSSSTTLKLTFSNSGSSAYFYLDNIDIGSYSSTSDTSCILAASNTSGLDTVLMALWNCNSDRVIGSFLKLPGLRQAFLEDYQTRMASAYSAYSVLSSAQGYFQGSGWYTGPSTPEVYTAHYVDPVDLLDYLKSSYANTSFAFYDIILSDYLPYLKSALETNYSSCDILSCIGTCITTGSGALNMPENCSNLLSYKIPEIADYSDDLLNNPDNHIYSKMFYCYPSSYTNKVTQNMASQMSQSLLQSVWPSVFSETIDKIPYTALLTEVNGMGDVDLLAKMANCYTYQITEAILEQEPRLFFNQLNSYRSLSAICTDFSLPVDADDQINMSQLLQNADRTALLTYLSATYESATKTAIYDLGYSYTYTIEPIIHAALTDCEFKTCLKSNWSALGYDSAYVFNYARTNDWVNIVQKLYDINSDSFTYFFADLYISKTIGILDNWDYPLDIFMQDIQTYFDYETRWALDGDTVTSIISLGSPEYHLYGSSRLGVYKREADIKTVEINVYQFVSNPSEGTEYEYTVATTYGNDFDSIYNLQLGKKLYEGSNHLGNVLVTYSDKRLATCLNDTIYYYRADLRTANDYAAFGMMMPDRQYYASSDSSNYRFGFNGQEKDNEVSGVGNSYTAEYWQYDSRLGRRFNLDPVVKEWESPYACFSNNPIIMIDIKGDSAVSSSQDVGVSGNINNQNAATLTQMLPAKSDPAQINVGYFGVNRTKIAGNANLKLNTDFIYISTAFGKLPRVDEPSSFCHINYTFSDNNQSVDFSAGLFRNHTKGDFLLDNGNDVHFSIGNSQIGIGVGIDLSTPEFQGFSASASVFIGAGPQLTQFTGSNGNTVSPEKWGVRGFGEVAVIGANMTTPTIRNVFSLTFSVKATIHQANFGDFSVTNSTTGRSTSYSGLNFTTGGITPTVQLNFNLSKRK